MMQEIRELAEIIKESNNIVFFGGAGVSTESNIPDFRSANGLWNEKLQINFTPEQLGYSPHENQDAALAAWGLTPYVDPEAEQMMQEELLTNSTTNEHE